MGTMTHNILLTRLQGEKTILLTRDGVPKDPYRRRHRPAEGGRMTPTLPPFVRPGSLQSPTFCWMLCDPSVFYRIWFWPSADAENTKPDHDEKSLHRHTIPCFVSSKSPFELQLGSRETPHASHHETEEERCLRRNQRRAAQAFWVRCEPSTPRRDPKTGGLARSSRRRAQPFLPTHCRSEGNLACLSGPPCSSSREGATHSMQVARWARTRSCSRSSILAPNSEGGWERISSAVQPCRSLRGSEADPTTSSRYSSFRGHERSLDPRKLRRAFRHSRTNSASPKGWRSTFSLWVWVEARKSPTRLSSPHWVLCQDIAQICKSFSKPVALQIRHTQTPVASTLDTDLPTDHRPCTSPEQSGEGSLQCQLMCLRQRKCSQSVKDQGEDVGGARLRPAL